MEFGYLSHKGQGKRECLHFFNATKHAHVTESANLLLERIWSVEDQDLFMVFEIQLVEGCRHSVMDSAGCERSRCGHITVQGLLSSRSYPHHTLWHENPLYACAKQQRRHTCS